MSALAFSEADSLSVSPSSAESQGTGVGTEETVSLSHTNFLFKILIRKLPKRCCINFAVVCGTAYGLQCCLESYRGT